MNRKVRYLVGIVGLAGWMLACDEEPDGQGDAGEVADTGGQVAPDSGQGGVAPDSGVEVADAGHAQDTDAGPAEETDAGMAAVRFQTLYDEIDANCSCHQRSPAAGGLDLNGLQAAYNNLVDVASSCNAQRKLVDPGNPDGSVLIHALENDYSQNADCSAVGAMPRRASALSSVVIDQFRSWITAGAPNN